MICREEKEGINVVIIISKNVKTEINAGNDLHRKKERRDIFISGIMRPNALFFVSIFCFP